MATIPHHDYEYVVTNDDWNDAADVVNGLGDKSDELADRVDTIENEAADIKELAVRGLCPTNELLYDDTGKPSVMVRIPKLTLAQLGMGDSSAVHPAFIVNGQEIDAIWISKYANIVYNGRAYSLPGQDPATSISWTTCYNACTAKGKGWHMMTRMEWGFLVRWCESNGFVPNGNNNYGKDADEDVYKAIPMAYNDSGQITRVATGTGPLTWSQNGEPDGIFDMKGNVWEFMGGIRYVYGELQVLANNNGADSENGQGSSSSLWMAIDAATGELVTPDGNGTTSGTVKMDYRSSTIVFDTEVTTATSTGDRYGYLGNNYCTDAIGDNAKLLLQELGMLKYSDDDLIARSNTNRCHFYSASNDRIFVSGGGYGDATWGVASFLSNTRSITSTNYGFRAAYCELPSA